MLWCLYNTTAHEIFLTRACRVTAIYKRNIFNYCCHRLHQRQNLPSGRRCYSAHAYSPSQKSNVQPFNSIPQLRGNYTMGPKTANNVTTTSDNHERKRVTITCRGAKQESGCSFHVSYVDHSREPQEDQPVVLGIHGTPGSLQDFIPMLKLLVEKGFRVVVPDYPGFGDTEAVSKNDYLCFTHTPEERADFAVKFMEAVGLSKVDLLIGHSSGGYPATFLASQKPEIFNGLMLICPGTGHVTPLPYYPRWFVHYMLAHWDSGGFVRQILEVCMNIGMKLIPAPFRDAEDIVTVAKVLITVDNKEMPKLAGLVADGPVALTYLYCDGDPIMATERSREYAAMFGVDRQKTDVYDSDAKLVETGCSPGGLLKKGVEFKRRTHFPPGHDDLCPIIVNELVTLYNATKRQANL